MLSEISNALESNLFSNSISFFSFILAAFTLIVGGKKVSEFLIEYQKRKDKAIFCFHSNMEVYIMRLERLIKDSDGNMSNVFFLFSAEEELKQKGKGYVESIKKLSAISESFLNFLSNSDEQVPPVDANKPDKLTEWYDELGKLIGYLNDFQLYDLGGCIPNMDTEEQAKEYFEKILNTLDYLHTTIKTEKEKYLENLK